MKSALIVLGDFGVFAGGTLSRVFSRRYALRSVTEQMYRVGVESLTVVNLCAFFIGLVLVLQSYFVLARFGAKLEVATMMSLAFVREIGPVFAAIMFAGRVGTGTAAEIGSMVVTEQVDAYRAFGLDPIAKIGVPRVLAIALMLPALTAIAVVVGIASGLLLAEWQLGLAGGQYIEKTRIAIDRFDLLTCLTKAVVFGLAIGLIGTFVGFRTPRATEAVGASTTKAMVASVLAILASDVVLTWIFVSVGGV